MGTSHWRQEMCLQALRDTAENRLCRIQSCQLWRETWVQVNSICPQAAELQVHTLLCWQRLQS